MRGLIDRLLPDQAIRTDLPSSGRATLTRQDAQKRHILHLLYGAPQVRGKAVPTDTGTRVMEMIEDIPTLGPVTASVRLPKAPTRVYDAMTGADVPFTNGGNRVEVKLPGLRIHSAIVFEGTSVTDDDTIPRRRPATIVDVAERAGVAIGTVSRYLNGHPIRRGNRDQIEGAIEVLGYRRNAVAAAMKTDLTNVVGFLVPPPSEFHAAVLDHLSLAMQRSGRALAHLLPYGRSVHR